MSYGDDGHLANPVERYAVEYRGPGSTGERFNAGPRYFDSLALADANVGDWLADAEDDGDYIVEEGATYLRMHSGWTIERWGIETEAGA